MSIAIRPLTSVDRTAWAAMRAALWPDEGAAAHESALDGILHDGDYWGFVAQDATGEPIGFAELALRKYANGCESQPVPFLEGIWVKPDRRRQSIGSALLRHISAFLVARGFHEIGSDAPLDNLVSHAAHHGWGFAETERVVYFRRVLD
jgi:aminoglycoside 6'-N-acetyltransferase I